MTCLPEAEAPQRVRRSVETDRNQCPRDGDLRSLFQAGDNGDKLTIITIASVTQADHDAFSFQRP